MQSNENSTLPAASRWLLLAGAILWGAGSAAAAVQPLWLGLAPAGGHTAASAQPLREGKAEGKRSAAAKPHPGAHAKGEAPGGGGSHWHGGGNGWPERFESEHRPLPVRTYFLQPPVAAAQVAGYLQKADGSVVSVDPTPEAGQLKLNFPAAMGEGPMHGANHLYAVESHLQGDTLVIRTAKWCTLHHNCGWGHDHKFDTERLVPHHCSAVPFEIVAHDLWDFNFHSRLMSGDQLKLDLLYRGKPAAGALVRVTSEAGWAREVTANAEGHATVQLIRDLYPSSWAFFDRNQLGELRVEARYAVDETGSLDGQPYRRVEVVSTFPWRYSQARRDYTSLAYGLLVATMTMAVAGLGVYIHRQFRCRPRREIVFDER